MRIGTMLGDVLRSLFSRTATRQYPVERAQPPTQLRGKLYYDPEQCTGCSLCVEDCPAYAIELITIDKTKKQFALRYHVDRCTFCGQCVESCRFKCIQLASNEWELASLDKAAFTNLYQRAENDASNVEKVAATDVETPDKE
ncbi:MAG: 4Fe-4S binding protein [Anaerolineae bacterium]|nr:4Fe-4S binding protein [Anaerolineae bacterium]